MRFGWVLLLMAVGAGPATSPVASALDQSKNPAVLLTDFNPRTLNVYGVRLGDGYDAVPNDKVQLGSGDGYLHLASNVGVLHDGKRITALVIWGEPLKGIGLVDRFDAELAFGVPDIKDSAHMIYLKRRLIVVTAGVEIVQIQGR